jgi:RHS repeat-associated protein
MNRVLTDTVPKTSNPVVNLTTSFTYNPSGTIQKITDPNVHYTWLYYDASDRKTSMTYHDSSTQGWSYDPAGNLQYRVSVNGTTKYLGYDIRDRLYVTTWSNWDDTTINPYWCSFTYDAAGRLSEAENGTSGLGTNVISDVHRYYDAAGRLTQEQQIVTGLGTYSINYPSYDDDGRLTRMSSVSGYDFTYSYDAMGRFEKIFVTGGGLPLFQYYYDAASNETERDNPGNGVNQLTPRDALNRITTWDARKGATTLAHEGYTYDPMDRITVVDWANGHTDSFQYYLDGELNIASLGNFGHTLTYNLDKMGNRTSVVDNTVTSTYSPNTINQYTTVAGSSVANGPEHEIQAYGAVTYVYMNDEHLESVAISGQSPSSATYSMVYDALGRCVKRTLTAGPTTYYIYDGEKPILEYDGTGASAGVNVYGKGIDEIVERVAIGSDSNWWTYYPQQNHEGSVTLLTDGSGNVLERYRYDAFGAPTIYTSTWGARANTIYDNRFLFTGREYAAAYRSTYINAVFSFYEYRARAYNPQLGRFMTEDPKVFDGGDYNLFRYCHNDPIDMTDPTGLDDTAPTYSPRQTSLKEAEDRAYNNIMAKAQMSLSARLEGGAIGASMAAYQGWSQLSEAMNSAHSLTAQSFIQAKSAWGFGGDNHGFTSSPSDAYRTSSTVYFSEGAEGSYVLSDTGKSYFLGRYVGKADASGLTGSAKVNGSVATVNMTGSATNPSPMLSSIAPSIQYNLNATINFGTHALSGSITRTAFPSYQVFLDNKSIYTHAEVGGPGFLYHVFSGTDSLGPSF